MPLPSPTGTERGRGEARESRGGRAARTAGSGRECAPPPGPLLPRPGPGPFPASGVRVNCSSPAGPCQAGQESLAGPSRGLLAFIPELSPKSGQGGQAAKDRASHSRGKSPPSPRSSGDKHPRSSPSEASAWSSGLRAIHGDCRGSEKWPLLPAGLTDSRTCSRRWLPPPPPEPVDMAGGQRVGRRGRARPQGLGMQSRKPRPVLPHTRRWVRGGARPFYVTLHSTSLPRV